MSASAHERDILAGTIAEMTWPEVEQAAKEGAVLLWAFGVIEQHGPHLPTGTDVYLPQAQLREVRRLLDERGIRALIVPPYYWGVNVVSGAFPASYRVRPEIMRELMADVFESFRGDGFRHVFCFSGHGDAAHNRAVVEGVRAGAQRTGLDISFVAEAGLLARLGLSADDPQITLQASQAGAPSKYVDVHAGQWETSMMMCSCAALVREQVRQTLRATDYGPEDLAEWRRGAAQARRKTPLGYFGDPARASAEQGVQSLRGFAARAADAIEARLQKFRTHP